MATKPMIWKGSPFTAAFFQQFFDRYFRSGLNRAHLERSGIVILGANEFADFEACIKTPKKPSMAINEGAEQLRRLYSKSR